ncbi:MAG: polynucleotide adenylyltransferase PcnB, partial [Thermoanaerobaculia bacterium]|nr:polynucleotide adenylyltransferase PcnB [Thermoanaerobaculia bacterium]
MPTSASIDAPRILPRSAHPISRRDIDRNALKVLYRLHRAGYRSYVVGGGVRDLMLRQRPKDFDIATNARPKEIRRLFNNSRIIGRRFRLVHVYFREGVIEVSTFRRDPDPEQQKFGPDDPLITDDNIFGTAGEDAFRRDFTINALFYDIADYSVIDYVGGIDDLEHQIVRTIGDAEVRLQEDPVRMVRACEFAGRLGFGIEEHTQRAIHALARQIERGAPSRLTEELVQLLRSGSAGPAMQWMLELELLDHFLPEAKAMLVRRTTADLGGMIPALDRAMAAGRELSDAAVVAAVLLPEVIRRARERSRGRTSDLKAAAFRDIVQGDRGIVANRPAPHVRLHLHLEQHQHVDAKFLRLFSQIFFGADP